MKQHDYYFFSDATIIDIDEYGAPAPKKTGFYCIRQTSNFFGTMDEQYGLVSEECGFVTREQLKKQGISNNDIEQTAFLKSVCLALPLLEEGYSVLVASDSNSATEIFEERFYKGVCPALKPLVDFLKEELAHYPGQIDFECVGSHPSLHYVGEIKLVKKDGRSYSWHNVHCDESCKQMRAEYLMSLKRDNGVYEELTG